MNNNFSSWITTTPEVSPGQCLVEVEQCPSGGCPTLSAITATCNLFLCSLLTSAQEEKSEKKQQSHGVRAALGDVFTPFGKFRFHGTPLGVNAVDQ